MLRTCPKCHAYYADPQLAFCFADGAPLIDVGPDSEKWQEGSRSIQDQAKRVSRRKRYRNLRRVVLGGLTLLLLALLFSNSYTVETTSPPKLTATSPMPLPTPHYEAPPWPVDSPPWPESSPSPSPSPSASVSPSPSPSVSPSPSPSPVIVYRITGQVRSGNRPLGGVSLVLGGSKSGTTTTDQNGNYTFADLPAGADYTIAPEAQMSFVPAIRTFTNLQQNESANFGVETFKISGQVSYNGRPLPGVKLLLSWAKATSTRTDANGNYSFTDLEAGREYKVTPDGEMNFTPESRAFNSLRRDESADFVAIRRKNDHPQIAPITQTSLKEKHDVDSSHK